MGGYTLSSTRELTARSVSRWCIDPRELESGDFATRYQGLHGKIAFHLQSQRLSPNSLNWVMES